MELRRSKFQLRVLFILMSCCWEGRWMGQAYRLGWHHGDFDSSDERIEGRLVSHRLRSSNMTADRCTNFYERVCGRATDPQDFYPIVLDRESWYTVLNTRFEAFLFAKITPDDEPAIQKVKRQYQLCMNYDKRDQDGFHTLESLLRKDSDFPMIMSHDSWDSLTLRILEPQKYDSSLFSIRVGNHEIYIDKYDVSVYGRFLSNLKNVSGITHPVRYKSKIKQVFQHMSLMDNLNRSDFERDLDAVMNLRHELHQIAKFGEIVHTRVTVEQLQRLVSIHHTSWPTMNWESFLQDVFVNVTGVEIDSQTEVNVDMEYMIAMRNLLRRYDPRCTANHIKLHFLETYLSETSSTLMEFSNDFAIAAHNHIGLQLQQQKPIYVTNPCINQPHILRALNYMYLKKWFPQKTRDAALNMKKEIKKSLLNYVRAMKIIPNDNIPWVEEQLYQTLIVIGSKKKYGEYEFLDPLYRYEVPDDHLSSVLNARRCFKEYEYSTLGTSKRTLLVDLDILGDDVYVSVRRNIIHLPIGYLHRSSLSPTLSIEKSYATLGHRISLLLNEVIIRKGFRSRKFSKQMSWYDADVTAFSNRTACIENQYRLQFLKELSITDEELQLNFNTHLERFVYDNAAFQTLYDAFRSVLHEVKVPFWNESSIKYMEREFMNNWASTYCMYENEDKRNPSPLRVNNVLRNTNGFHSSFNCPDRSPMNPHEKCIFWG